MDPNRRRRGHGRGYWGGGDHMWPGGAIGIVLLIILIIILLRLLGLF